MTFPAMHSATLSPGEVVRKGPTAEPMVLGPGPSILACSQRSVTRQSLCGLQPRCWGSGGWVWGRGWMCPTSQASSCPAACGTLHLHWVPSRALQVSQQGPALLPVVTTLVSHLDVDTLVATPAPAPAWSCRAGTLHLLRPGPSSEDAGLLLWSSKNDCSDPCEWVLPVKSPGEQPASPGGAWRRPSGL